MRNSSFMMLVAIALSTNCGPAGASNHHDAYFAEMERMAAESDKVNAQSTETIPQTDLRTGLARLRKTSPTAYAVFKHLRPAFQEEVRKAIISGQDSRTVAKLIFARNKQALYGRTIAKP
jgi:hypothetical protein